MCGMLVYYRPYISTVVNRFELFNEFMILSVGYFAMAAQGLTRSPFEGENCGVCIIWTIRIHIGANLLFILYLNSRTVYLYIKRFMAKRRAVEKSKVRLSEMKM